MCTIPLSKNVAQVRDAAEEKLSRHFYLTAPSKCFPEQFEPGKLFQPVKLASSPPALSDIPARFPLYRYSMKMTEQ